MSGLVDEASSLPCGTGERSVISALFAVEVYGSMDFETCDAYQELEP
jgi:hypothetical protein